MTNLYFLSRIDYYLNVVADPDGVIRFREEGTQFFALNALSILTNAAKNLLKTLKAD